MLKDKLTQTLSESYLGMNGIEINEGANDYESEHKSILKKLGKHAPELNLDQATHTHKHSGTGHETHTYSVTHSATGNNLHDHILGEMKTHVDITHHQGKTYGRVKTTYGQGGYNQVEHHSFEKNEDGTLHVRDHQGVTHKL